jgi:1,4-alpha-glucan branching enzyme
MMYAYSEKFMLAYSHDEAVHMKGTMLGKMPGDEASKFAALRLTYAYMMMHPGKKLLFMGQDIAEYQEFSEQRPVNFDLLQYPVHNGVKTLIKDLNELYRTNLALTKLDNHPNGFRWINCDDYQASQVSFVRKSDNPEEMLVVVANFSGISRNITVGVPLKGKYKEILNTDAKKYAGSGIVNTRQKVAKKISWDGFDYSINLDIGPQSVAILEYRPIVRKG